MLREKIQTLLKMNLLSLFSHWEICVPSHLLYFLWLNSLSMWTFLFLTGEKLKDKMCCVCPLNLINWYSFPDIISEGVRDHIPKPVKINRSSANFSEFWTRLKVKCVAEYIKARCFVLLQNVSFPWSSCVMHLLLWNAAVGLFLSLWWSEPADTSFISLSESRMWL